MKHNATRGRVFFRSAAIRVNQTPLQGWTIAAFDRCEIAHAFFAGNLKRLLA